METSTPSTSAAPAPTGAATPASRAFAVPVRSTDTVQADNLIEIENFDFYYGAKQALFDINLKLRRETFYDR